ncbi:telomere repeat-binding factor 2 [Tripterygium wilfordii]|uniref:MYB transcription factor n=1 Tax=Tripterygium wilfordii TaxID=458696 RepID=A0A7J7DTI3_TRIWF|nr:telomere repeat-binding factor 2-like [Tripterygium wilfordii]XP_038688175.1 telomere repeat-binding factor 2-like [Tripterygium wilfordii]XP_038688182.1 telomere repeat-binding factor 2-like [Tripterygium wilfordii]KAF5749678.1 telomere repeat-binding factor 2 [Tripterygium wilfordii]
MGAPKQKWTAEEEAALKAGVRKHGMGKWRTILMDPEFSDVLQSRSNVDLKDKWRNINVTAIWGSRQKAKLALKKSQPTSKNEGKMMALSTEIQTVDEGLDVNPPAVSSGMPRNASSKEPVKRLDNLILEAITKLKEPSGSDKASVASYIEEKYGAPNKLKRLVGTKLKLLTASSKLIKVKHKYRIAPSSTFSEPRRCPPQLLLEGRKMDSLKPEKPDPNNVIEPQTSKAEQGSINIFTKPQINAELSKMRNMTAEEAAAAAAQAVAEAEIAIAEAEAAAREAEEAEEEAEAAQVFAKAAMKALRYRNLHT